MEGYCMSCRAKVEMKEPFRTEVKGARKTNFKVGKCATCGKDVWKIVPKAKK